MWFLFPDSPVDAHFFTPEEKVLAVKRVAEAKLGVKNTQFKWYQVRSSPARLSYEICDLIWYLIGQTCLERSEDLAAVHWLHLRSNPKWVRTAVGLL